MRHPGAFLVLLAASALVGCGADGVPPSVRAEAPPAWTPSDDASVCAVTFSPAPELEGATNSAASDWSRATGCEITVGPGGIPVELADAADIVDEDGVEHNGATSPTRDLIRISRATARRFHVMLHEMGHALGGEHVDTAGALSGWPQRLDVIDGASLESVCAVLACPLMAPGELPPG